MVDDFPTFFHNSQFLCHIYELKVGTSLRVDEPSLTRFVIPLQIEVFIAFLDLNQFIYHMDADKVGHVCVHHLPREKLEGKLSIIFGFAGLCLIIL
jgi:hypothetical protein